MQYNSFYFLHIPKTGGRFLKRYLIPHISKNLKIIEGEDRHGGWDKNIDDNTYILSALRDPIKLICSLYIHLVTIRLDLLINDSISHLNIKNVNLDKKYFLQWIEKATEYHNIQSKNILISGPVFDKLYEFSIFKKIDIKTLEKRIDRINFIVDQDYMMKNPDYVFSKICYDLNIEKPTIVNDITTYSNIGSKILYDKLDENDKNKISKYFDVDYMIYNKIRGDQNNG